MNEQVIQANESIIAQPVDSKYVFRSKKGLSEEIIREISKQKQEPQWMLEKRLEAYEIFKKKPMPAWGADLSALNFDEIIFYIKPEDYKAMKWEDVPETIRKTYDALGIPEAEKKYLAGLVAQYESEAVYTNLKKAWEGKGVIFTDMDSAVKDYPELVKEYFMTKCVPPTDNKFAALHGAVWSGGSFVYVPKGVKVEIPLQTYFRMNTRSSGQFEHTLIIVEPRAEVHYIEGCTAPRYSISSLHSAVVEIFVKEGARARYTTIQNWSTDVYNLNTKRAIVYENGIMEWVGGSMGSGVTMLYPASILRGRGARAEHLNIAFAGKGQYKDTGAKVILAAPDTSATIVSKSISKDGGTSVYRGLVRIGSNATGAKAHVECQSLMLDDRSHVDTIPIIEQFTPQSSVGHEATVGKIDEEQLFYLMSRGISKDEAIALIVRGFIEPVAKELPMGYAVELNRLIQLEMKGA
ncbi:MAG: Fe-S cluster assembly protein SufB [bacterium]